MVRLNKLKAAVMVGVILGIMSFGAAYGYAQEEKPGVNASHGQNMDQMMATDHEQSPENGGGSHGSPDGSGRSHEQSQEGTGGGHGESIGEEPVPWGFLYGFLAVNGAIVVTAGVMKVIKQRTVQELRG